jgi:hypothetical protein
MFATVRSADGFEVIDADVAVISYGASDLKEALLLRTYTARLTLLTLGEPISLGDDEFDQVRMAYVRNGWGAASLPFVPMRSYSAMTWAPNSNRVAAISRLRSTTIDVVSDP